MLINGAHIDDAGYRFAILECRAVMRRKKPDLPDGMEERLGNSEVQQLTNEAAAAGAGGRSDLRVLFDDQNGSARASGSESGRETRRARAGDDDIVVWSQSQD